MSDYFLDGEVVMEIEEMIGEELVTDVNLIYQDNQSTIAMVMK